MWSSVKIIAALALALALAGGCSQPNKKRRQVVSPIGGYVATAEPPKPKSPGSEIKITRAGEKAPLLTFPFGRQVEVVWAPDESAVAVVDMVLQNETRVVIFGLPSGRLLHDVRREHVCEINPELPCGAAYSHVFFSQVIWRAPDRIELTVDMINPLEPNLPPQIRAPLLVTFPAPPRESTLPGLR